MGAIANNSSGKIHYIQVLDNHITIIIIIIIITVDSVIIEQAIGVVAVMEGKKFALNSYWEGRGWSGGGTGGGGGGGRGRFSFHININIIIINIL